MSELKLLTKADIMSAQDLRTERVAVPEWGGVVIVRELTGAQRDAFESTLVVTDAKGKRAAALDNLRAKLVACAVVDEAGAPVFTAADVKALGGKSAVALDRLFTVAQRLSGMSSNDVDAAEKNSATDPSDGSLSA